MNSISDGVNYIGNPQQRRFSRLVNSVWLVAIGFPVVLALLPLNAGGQGFHGGVSQKTAVGPSGLSIAHVGDTITATIRLRNSDLFSDSLTVTSIVDIVHHATGDVVTANLLMTPVTLTNLTGTSSLTQVQHIYTVLASDVVSNNFLFDEGRIGYFDNHDGPGQDHIPASLLGIQQ